MKPYMVIRVDVNRMLDMVPGDRGELRFMCFAHTESESVRPQNFNGDHPAYFVENEANGNTLAAHLALRKPGSCWVVAKSVSSFRSTPGPVAKATFTEHGMLPAI